MADLDRFWSTIDGCRRETTDLDELASALVDALKDRSVEEILDFRAAFDECLNRAYRWDLWGAAYVINGGCSDDGFDYFIGWLIAQGRDYFESALKDPERAGDAAGAIPGSGGCRGGPDPVPAVGRVPGESSG